MFRSTPVSLFAVALSALALAPASLAAQPVSQTLNPPPPSFESCKTVGGGTICSGTQTSSYGPVDTGIACGSGTSVFDIFDQGTDTENATRYYDGNGNLTRRVLHDKYSFGQWSNPITGATVNYTQNNVQTDVSPSREISLPRPRRSPARTSIGQALGRLC
jgi:opacity protein-like surface antigen